MTSNPSPSESGDSKKPDDGEDEFLDMDPTAFESVDDLFADPSMLESEGPADAKAEDVADGDEESSEESDWIGS